MHTQKTRQTTQSNKSCDSQIKYQLLLNSKNKRPPTKSKNSRNHPQQLTNSDIRHTFSPNDLPQDGNRNQLGKQHHLSQKNIQEFKAFVENEQRLFVRDYKAAMVKTDNTKKTRRTSSFSFLEGDLISGGQMYIKIQEEQQQYPQPLLLGSEVKQITVFAHQEQNKSLSSCYNDPKDTIPLDSMKLSSKLSSAHKDSISKSSDNIIGESTVQNRRTSSQYVYSNQKETIKSLGTDLLQAQAIRLAPQKTYASTYTDYKDQMSPDQIGAQILQPLVDAKQQFEFRPVKKNKALLSHFLQQCKPKANTSLFTSVKQKHSRQDSEDKKLSSLTSFHPHNQQDSSIYNSHLKDVGEDSPGPFNSSSLQFNLRQNIHGPLIQNQIHLPELGKVEAPPPKTSNFRTGLKRTQLARSQLAINKQKSKKVIQGGRDNLLPPFVHHRSRHRDGGICKIEEDQAFWEHVVNINKQIQMSRQVDSQEFEVGQEDQVNIEVPIRKSLDKPLQIRSYNKTTPPDDQRVTTLYDQGFKLTNEASTQKSYRSRDSSSTVSRDESNRQIGWRQKVNKSLQLHKHKTRKTTELEITNALRSNKSGSQRKIEHRKEEPKRGRLINNSRKLDLKADFMLNHRSSESLDQRIKPVLEISSFNMDNHQQSIHSSVGVLKQLMKQKSEFISNHRQLKQFSQITLNKDSGQTSQNLQCFGSQIYDKQREATTATVQTQTADPSTLPNKSEVTKTEPDVVTVVDPGMEHTGSFKVPSLDLNSLEKSVTHDSKPCSGRQTLEKNTTQFGGSFNRTLKFPKSKGSSSQVSRRQESSVMRSSQESFNSRPRSKLKITGGMVVIPHKMKVVVTQKCPPVKQPKNNDIQDLFL